MKVLKIIGIILLVLIVLIVILAFIAPQKYSVERSEVINSPKELIFSHVKYWRNWTAWLPWAASDPEMQVTIEGTDGEIGSMYKWVGDPKVTGQGEMTNTGVKSYEEIAFHLHFIKPWESESDGYVRLAEANGGTMVSWGIYGEVPIPWNIMLLFTSMEKMVGKDFEKGLAMLKNICEKEAKAVLSYEVKEVQFKQKKYAVIQKEVPFSDIKQFYTESFAAIDKTMRKKYARLVGAPAGLYYSWDEQKMVTDMAAAVPVSKSISSDEIRTITLPVTKAYMVDYYGPYSGVGPAHLALELYLVKNELKIKFPVIEEYITDPESEPDSSKWLTKIYYFAE